MSPVSRGIVRHHIASQQQPRQDRAERSRKCESEGDVVVEFANVTAVPLRLALMPRRTFALRLAAKHLHVLGDDLGGITVLPFLVLPFPRLQLALNEYLRALAQIFGDDLGELVECDY